MFCISTLDKGKADAKPVAEFAAKEKEVNGCGKFSLRRIRAVPSAAATKVTAAP